MICLSINIARLNWVSNDIEYCSRAVMKSITHINSFYCNLGAVMAERTVFLWRSLCCSCQWWLLLLPPWL